MTVLEYGMSSVCKALCQRNLGKNAVVLLLNYLCISGNRLLVRSSYQMALRSTELDMLQKA